MLRPLLITLLLSPVLAFAQELPTQFTGQNAIHSNPARIGMNSNLRVSSFVQNPNKVWGTGVEYFNEKLQIGIGAGIHHQTTTWARNNKLSLALNRRWGNDQKFISAAIMLNSFTREFLPPYEECNNGVQFPLGYATASFGLNGAINQWNFDLMTEFNIGSQGGSETKVYTQVARQFNLGELYIEPSLRNYLTQNSLRSAGSIGHDANLLIRYNGFVGGAGVTVSASGRYFRPMAGFQKNRWSLFYMMNRYQEGSWTSLTNPIPVNHELSLQINPFGMKNRSTSWIL